LSFMAGLLIYESYGQFYSFVIADNELYEMTKKDLSNKGNHKVYFGKGNLNLEQLDNSRDKVSELVKLLNEGKRLDVKKEFSDCFN